MNPDRNPRELRIGDHVAYARAPHIGGGWIRGTIEREHKPGHWLLRTTEGRLTPAADRQLVFDEEAK